MHVYLIDWPNINCHGRKLKISKILNCRNLYLKTGSIRVGSHVVSVSIHCTEKWRTSFHTDVLSKSK